MKTILCLASTLAAAFLLRASALLAADAQLEQQFPHIIQFELGASGFAAGDQITITSVRGDRAHIEPGGGYLVEGTYTLASVEHADLAFHCTSRGPSGSTPVENGQQIKIVAGTGHFQLYRTNLADGWLHVSFYFKGNSHGGIYFGEKGRENTIMRKQEWFREYTDKSGGEKIGGPIDFASPANRALMTYLGNPVPPPANMDARYNQENLVKAFTTVSGKAGLVVSKLAVDDSEFPFILYGILEGKHSLPDRRFFEDIKGYTYGGSVRGSTGEGATCFALNMVPQNQYPANQEEACNRRLMVRLQMLSNRAWQIK